MDTFFSFLSMAIVSIQGTVAHNLGLLPKNTGDVSIIDASSPEIANFESSFKIAPVRSDKLDPMILCLNAELGIW